MFDGYYCYFTFSFSRRTTSVKTGLKLGKGVLKAVVTRVIGCLKRGVQILFHIVVG